MEEDSSVNQLYKAREAEKMITEKTAKSKKSSWNKRNETAEDIINNTRKKRT